MPRRSKMHQFLTSQMTDDEKQNIPNLDQILQVFSDLKTSIFKVRGKRRKMLVEQLENLVIRLSSLQDKITRFPIKKIIPLNKNKKCLIED